MTLIALLKDKMTNIKRTFISFSLLFAALFLGIGVSGEMAGYVTEGMRLAVGTVIPSSFPFMIISDFYVQYGKPENLSLARLVFTRLMRLPATAIAPFICGNVGGFPIGAKMTCDAYQRGEVSKEDAERLLPLCSNPSCAFVVGGVGLGIFADIKVGILLLVSLYLSVAVCGFISRTSRIDFQIRNVNVRQNYSFINSVKSSGISLIGLISFISIFSVILGLIKNRVKNAYVFCIISIFLELTNAVNYLGCEGSIPRELAMSLSAFSLGFGGLCVAMQSMLFTSEHGLNIRKYFRLKLLEGLLSASFFILLYYII